MAACWRRSCLTAGDVVPLARRVVAARLADAERLAAVRLAAGRFLAVERVRLVVVLVVAMGGDQLPR